ncbi:MAG: transglutaminase family protein [Bacteroidia bacterium]|nr:transglutaminase family protein [Bacteroidia bacterium]
MKDTEFKALIRLLDDDDPDIGAHIEQTLISLGGEAIPRLEEAWEQEKNELVQSRIEDIIHVIQSKNTIDELRQWRQQGNASLLRGWFLLTQYQYPELRFVDFKNIVNRLVNKIWLELRSGMNTVEKLRVINRMFFEKEKYKADRKHPYEPQNYLLNGVIDKKNGSPISLSLLYMIVCHELDLPVNGVILPGYFVLTVPGHEDELYIDVFNRGTFFTQKDLTRYLKDMNVSNHEQYYRASTHVQIMFELIQTLIVCYQKKKNPEKVKGLETLLQEISPE